MRAAGDSVTVRIVPNQGHVELIAPETAAWAEAKRQIGGAFVTPALSRVPDSPPAQQGSGTLGQARGDEE
jgi:hypothetical protein